MRNPVREWLFPSLAVVAATLALFAITFGLDHGWRHPGILSGDVNTFRGTLIGIAESLAATLGLMAAIVLVIVQLSANRYTPKIIESFTHNLTNLCVFSLFIISIIYSLWVAQTVQNDFLPRYGACLALVLMTACYALIIPYFLFIFRILSPHYIVETLRKTTLAAIRRAPKGETRQAETRKIVTRRMEQIADIAMSCIQNVDEEIARHSVMALQSLLHGYAERKEAFGDEWHAIGDEALMSSPRRLAEEVIRRQAWVEFRALRQLRILYRNSSGKLPEMNSLIAQAIRSVGSLSADKGDLPVVDLVVMFFNSLVRSAVSMKDGRACSDTFYQYRLLAEKILETHPLLAQRVVTYFMYYGRMILEVEIRQIFDTICYDIRKINERALKVETRNFKVPMQGSLSNDLLQTFLGLYRRVDAHKYATQWRALVKHYLSLASFYLCHGQEVYARRVVDVIEDTPPDTVKELQQEILNVSEPLFWEISDRIINFNFIPLDQRQSLIEITRWMGVS